MLYYLQQPELFDLQEVAADPADHRPHYRLTVDTPEDFALVRAIFGRLSPGHPRFSLRDIIGLLDASPELVEINRDVVQRDLREQVNVHMHLVASTGR
jgi:spore coat polysaccharide biosynthesis protein SpsF